MNILEAKEKLYQKIKHLNCVKGCGLQDDKTIIVLLKHQDQDALHEIPMFYEGFKVYHKVQADTPKPKPKTEDKKTPKGPTSKGKSTTGSGSITSVEGFMKNIKSVLGKK
jgi:hypothetical protein